MIELARQYGRYGYRRIAALLRDALWQVNAKRVERLWRRQGLKVPSKQPKKSRLWRNDGSCLRLSPIRCGVNCPRGQAGRACIANRQRIPSVSHWRRLRGGTGSQLQLGCVHWIHRRREQPLAYL